MKKYKPLFKDVHYSYLWYRYDSNHFKSQLPCQIGPLTKSNLWDKWIEKTNKKIMKYKKYEMLDKVGYNRDVNYIHIFMK